MARATAVLLLLAALLFLLRAGDAQMAAVCRKTDIAFAVNATGNVVRGQPEYVVTMETACPCPMKDVRVWCGGLESSAVPLDASKVELDEGMCVLKQPVSRDAPLVLTYSSEVPVRFRVFNAVTAC